MKIEYVFYTCLCSIGMFEVILLFYILAMKKEVKREFNKFNDLLQKSLRKYELRVELLDDSLHQLYSELDEKSHD